MLILIKLILLECIYLIMLFLKAVFYDYSKKNGKYKSWEFWKRQDKDSNKLELFVSAPTIKKQNEMDLLLRDITTFLSFQSWTNSKQLELDHTNLLIIHLNPVNIVANMLPLHTVDIWITQAVTHLVRANYSIWPSFNTPYFQDDQNRLTVEIVKVCQKR